MLLLWLVSTRHQASLLGSALFQMVNVSEVLWWRLEWAAKCHKLLHTRWSSGILYCCWHAAWKLMLQHLVHSRPMALLYNNAGYLVPDTNWQPTAATCSDGVWQKCGFGWSDCCQAGYNLMSDTWQRWRKCSRGSIFFGARMKEQKKIIVVHDMMSLIMSREIRNVLCSK